MSVRSKLYNFYVKVQPWIVPGLKNSQAHYFRELTSILGSQTRWLDLGCGHQIVPWWVNRDQLNLVSGIKLGVGVDLDLDSLRRHPDFHNKAICDLRWIPFVNGAFNLISANMVAEHLEEPEAVFGEAFRALEPGGLFIVHTPNRKNYQSVIASLLPQKVKEWLMRILDEVPANDVFKTFYRVNTREDISGVAGSVGFEVVRVEMVNTVAKAKLLGPLVIPELLWIRILENPRMSNYRADIIVVLKKPAQGSAGA